MTAKELKASILDLAIRGKLVPQDPNDEPAENLLARIAAEKAKLVKSGKLKKEKPLPPITDDDKPFDLPHGWTWCRLGDIATRITDGTHKTPKYVSSGVRFVSAKDIGNGKLDFDRCKFITEDEHRVLYSRCNPEQGDLLVSKSGSIGDAALVDVEFEFSLFESLALIKFISHLVYAKYLLYAVRQLCGRLSLQDVKGVGVKHLHLNIIARQVVSLPPFAEQKRIVEKIEQLMPLVERYGQAEEKRRQLIATLPEALKKSILKSAVEGKLVPQDPNDEPAEKLLARIAAEKAKLIKSGKLKKDKTESVIFRGADRLAYETRNGKTVCIEDELPFKIPDSWAWARLGSVVYNHGQKTPTSSFCYIDIGSIDNRRQRLSDQERILTPKEASPRARKIVAQGDILYSCVRPYLHNACIIDKTFSKEVIASTGFAVMVAYDGVFNKFLFLYLMSAHFDRYANDSDNAKGMAYPAISDRKLYEAIIPLPPLAEQKRIVTKIDEIMKLVKPLTM